MVTPTDTTVDEGPFVARNAMLSAVHIDDATQQAHLFMVWSNGEWSTPGGHVILADADLKVSAQRKWDEEVSQLIGHGTLAETAHTLPMQFFIHTVRKPESVQFPVDAHAFVSRRQLPCLPGTTCPALPPFATCCWNSGLATLEWPAATHARAPPASCLHPIPVCTPADPVEQRLF